MVVPIRRRLLIVLGAMVLAPAVSRAQDAKIRRVGFLAGRARPSAARPDRYYEVFAQTMRELGYVEGRNLAIEWRYAEGNYDRLPALAGELVAARVEVLVTHFNAGAGALQRATASIPIVCSAMTDPVGSGFAVSLARPGRNITGLSNVSIDVSTKRLDLLAQLLPKLSRVGVLSNPASTFDTSYRHTMEEAARGRGITLLQVSARSESEIERAFARMARDRVEALLIINDAFFLGQVRQLAELSAKYRLPGIFPYSDVAAAGGLMSYGQNYAASYRRTAAYVDKILRGAQASDLPIEQPTQFELVINRKAAAALGITLPPELALRVDRFVD